MLRTLHYESLCLNIETNTNFLQCKYFVLSIFATLVNENLQQNLLMGRGICYTELVNTMLRYAKSISNLSWH